MKPRSSVLLFILILTIGGYASGGLKAVANSAVAAVTSGTIDGAVIGGTTPAAITGTTITATTKFLAADGTAGAPSYSFSSAPTAGMYVTGGQVAFSVAGTLSGYFSSSGIFTLPLGALSLPTDTSTIRLGASSDLYIKRYAAKQASITADGTGATTNAGWIAGYLGTSGYGGLWASPLTPSTTNYALRQGASGDTRINAATGQIADLAVNDVAVAAASSTGLAITGTFTQTAKTTNYNNVATAGWGVPAIYGAGRSTAQTAGVASVATYTVGAADGSFIVSGNVNVTTATAHSFSLQVDYTDETNTARTVTMNVQQLGGTLVTAITNVTGAGPYEGVPLHLRCKASTAITVKTTGTFTTVTYNVEGNIRQIS